MNIEPKVNKVSTKVGIVVASFNELITESLLSGALSTLSQHEIDPVAVVKVPGAFELPFAAQQLAKTGKVDGIICLGCVIRGATPHFDYVCSEASRGINQVGLEFEMPVIFGVLTTNTIDEALERAGTKAGNKGRDAAECLLHMRSIQEQIKSL